MHKIIEASETLDGKFALTIEWGDGTETREIVSENAARGLGYHFPDEPAPEMPISREARALLIEVRSGLIAYTGGLDEACSHTIARITEELGDAVARAA